MKKKLTPFAKLLIVAVIIAGLGFAFYKYKDKIIPNSGNKTENTNTDGERVIKVGVVTWGGYAGGQYFNEGFAANKESRFYKDYGFMVEFKVLDDFVASRNAWKTGDVDLLWATIDAFTTEAQGLQQFEPQVIFQADWSRGGDAVVVTRGINNVKDLKGKKVAFAEMTPSHTFLLWLLEAGGLTYSDIDAVKVANAIDAADLFKKGKVDAAVVWSPDDADCVAKVPGSKILQSTKSASHIIFAYIFIAKN
jgi:NitT/TauT family transport system substrate-binding protein